MLASGDPFHYGVGAVLARHIDAREMVVLPAASAFSLAAARLGWSLQRTVLLSLHGRMLDLIRPHLQPASDILALTSDGDAPAALARLLTESGFGKSRLTVLEALGGPRERIRATTAAGFDLGTTDALNVVAIEVTDAPDARVLARTPGLADHLFEHDGQITKREIRAVTLSSLSPRRGELLWDIGSGSGSVAIEWMLADHMMRAIAIEHRADRAARIRRNAAAFGVPGLDIIEGAAPAALSGLETPQAIFVGGGAGDPARARYGGAGAAARRPARGQCGDARDRGAAARAPRRVGRRLDPRRDFARGCGWRKNRLATGDAGDAMAMDQAMTVHFIGAGPGAADLITVRGRDLIARCPVCLYAGSIVPRELLSYCPPGARIVDTAPLSLDEIETEFVSAHAAGLDVARLQSGDLSIYSALAEQLRRLDRRGIPYTLTPGVPAFAAAAAALQCELTVPEVAQSVVLTRVSGRASRMPESEKLATFAASGATLVIHLAIHAIEAIVEELTPFYGVECPAAVVVQASSAQQRVIRGTLADIAAKVSEARIERTALIFVGRALAAENFRDSALYDADYRRRFRGGAA